MPLRPLASLALLLVLAALPSAPCAAAEQLFEFHAPALASDPTAAPAMRDLALRMLPVYVDADHERYLANLSALQLVAGNYAPAYAARRALRERRPQTAGLRSRGRMLAVDIYARGRALQADANLTFADAFARAFDEVVPALDDLTAYGTIAWYTAPAWETEIALQHQFDLARTHVDLSMAEAMQLIWAYLAYDVYRQSAGIVPQLIAEDDLRRYLSDSGQVRMRDGTRLSVQIMRPRGADRQLPALLKVVLGGAGAGGASGASGALTPASLRECAAHGYIGLIAYARGGGDRPAAAPFEHDADDVRSVIEWIAQQSWSDGRVGMYGGGYSAYAQWAVARHAPRALQALAPASAMVPGIDWPMRGNIFLNAAYRWARQLALPPPADPVAAARLEQLDERWYRSGRPYRDLDRLDGTHIALFHRWLEHPNFDRYWQRLLPYEREFAQVDVSVLTTTGYYDTGELGALYTFMQHTQYADHPDHVLVVGPYDDGALQEEPMAWERGLDLDPVALVDLRELRFQWFDYILKGRPKPAWLADRINFQLPGANEWRHAASLTDLQGGTLRLYLSGQPSAGPAASGASVPARGGHDRPRRSRLRRPVESALPPQRLTARAAAPETAIDQTVDFADRSDADWTPPVQLSSATLPVHHSIVFVSDVLTQPLDLAGLLRGALEFQCNKADLDLSLALYELTSDGRYVALFAPVVQMRASYVADPAHRHFLDAGRRRLDFASRQLFARRAQAGSRIVFVLSVIKRPDEEINYGARSTVSEQSIADAAVPLQIRWYGGSYIDLPLAR